MDDNQQKADTSATDILCTRRTLKKAATNRPSWNHGHWIISHWIRVNHKRQSVIYAGHSWAMLVVIQAALESTLAEDMA